MGLVEIAGYYTNLKKGFEELGVPATFVDLSGHPFRYGGRRSSRPWTRVLRWVRQAATRLVTSRQRLEPLHRALQTVLGLPLLLWGLCRYDVFIFGYGSSLLGFWDLPILKAFGKKVIHVFHGSDVRPPFTSGSHAGPPGNLTVPQIIRLTRQRKRMLRRIERWTDVCVNHTPQSQFHERPFVSWAFVGMPFEADDVPVSPSPRAEGQPLRILHCPSNPEIKGTAEIRRAIRNLQAKGHNLDYDEIIGQPHPVVLKELARCDLVVDEIYSDNYMAGFATEAAFFGKPAVVAGYAREELERAFPPEKRPPVLFCHPEEIEAGIEHLVTDEEARSDLGRRARQFVRSHWAPRKVAEAFLAMIENRAPQEWFYDPADIRHVRGMGLPEHRCRALVREVIETGGVEALCLSDKPDLERRFVEFARGEA